MPSRMEDLSVEKFIDYLSPMLAELGTDVIQMESPACYDKDGYGYLAKSRFIFYKHGTKVDEQNVIETMAADMKIEVECRIKLAEHNKCDMHTERLGIYNIHVQYDSLKDEDLEEYNRTKEQQHVILIWVRYSFGDKDRELLNIKRSNI